MHWISSCSSSFERETTFFSPSSFGYSIISQFRSGIAFSRYAYVSDRRRTRIISRIVLTVRPPELSKRPSLYRYRMYFWISDSVIDPIFLCPNHGIRWFSAMRTKLAWVDAVIMGCFDLSHELTSVLYWVFSVI